MSLTVDDLISQLLLYPSDMEVTVEDYSGDALKIEGVFLRELKYPEYTNEDDTYYVSDTHIHSEDMTSENAFVMIGIKL